MDFLKRFRTRWNKISSFEDSYRLACSHPVCSLSCANLKKGKLSLTSVHGTERHSYEFTPVDMFFVTITFLDSLSDKELENFTRIFNKTSSKMRLNLEQKQEE